MSTPILTSLATPLDFSPPLSVPICALINALLVFSRDIKGNMQELFSQLLVS
jgi:hypothetical protein